MWDHWLAWFSWHWWGIYVCYVITCTYNDLRGNRILITALCFLLCICAATAGASNWCTNDISFLELHLVILEAHNTPHTLVRAVVSKKLATSNKVCPRPVFSMWRHDRIEKGWVRDKWIVPLPIYLRYMMLQCSLCEVIDCYLNIISPSWLMS